MRLLSMRDRARSTREAITERGFGRARRDVDHTQPQFEILAQAAEALEVVGAGGGELHGEVLHPEPVELGEDRPVGAGMMLLAAHPRTCPSAEMDGELDAVEARARSR